MTGHIDSDGEFIANGKGNWKTDFDYAREGDIEAVKLIKNSEIAAKKLATAAAKGRPATAPTPAAPKAKATPAGTGSSAAAAGAAAPPAAAISTGHTTAEDVIVADLLACLKALEVPEGVLASIEAQRGSLRGAIAPRVTALRNSAYAQGFSAKASI